MMIDCAILMVGDDGYYDIMERRGIMIVMVAMSDSDGEDNYDKSDKDDSDCRDDEGVIVVA